MNMDIIDKKRHIKVVIVVFIAAIFFSLNLYAISNIYQKKKETRQSINTSLSLIGEVYFFDKTIYPDVFAIGMIINNNHSIVFLWNKTANTILIEVDYICPS
ncbi:MAG: hypothetical protein DRH49_07585, partial [Candidatus Coatesbacteria bacterium]